MVELHLQLSPSMTACQTSLLDLIDACVKELKICNPKVGFNLKNFKGIRFILGEMHLNHHAVPWATSGYCHFE